MNFIINQLFAANKYFNDQEPWKKKADIERLNTIVYVALELIRKITIMLNPIIPESSNKVLKALNLNADKIKFDEIKIHEFLPQGTKINKLDILFKKIDKND